MTFNSFTQRSRRQLTFCSSSISLIHSLTFTSFFVYDSSHIFFISFFTLINRCRFEHSIDRLVIRTRLETCRRVVTILPAQAVRQSRKATGLPNQKSGRGTYADLTACSQWLLEPSQQPKDFHNHLSCYNSFDLICHRWWMHIDAIADVLKEAGTYGGIHGLDHLVISRLKRHQPEMALESSQVLVNRT